MKNFMLLALEQAKQAFDNNEVPVGAVIVRDNCVIAKAHNTTLYDNSLLSHAEINVINQASKFIKNSRLDDCYIYVTLEPCCMCIGALSLIGIKGIFFGAYRSKSLQSDFYGNVLQSNFLDYLPVLYGGILENECSELIKKFFHTKRV